MELERLVVARGVVDLVRDQEDGLARGAEDGGDLLVPGGHARAGVGQEQDDVGLLDGLARLRRDRAHDRRPVGDVHASGIDEHEALAGPLALELLAVARHPGRLVDDRGAGLCQPVDERRLADVGEADDRDRSDQRRLGGRFAHLGGTATAGRPRAWISARKSKSDRIRRPISPEASR